MRTCALLLLPLLAARPALAQVCPDGTPPPCRASPAVRAPALDANTWLVLPFANRTAHADSTFLREGTATLLRYELERWPELTVVDEAAVAEQLRRRGLQNRALTVEEARGLARAFGAGNVVLGEVMPGPHSVRVVARSYATQSGRRVREGTVVTSQADSAFTSAMGSVAAGLLNLAQVPGEPGSAVGTQSLAAYREYVLGRLEMRRMNSAGALAHYQRAIALDSTFALAHYASYWASARAASALARRAMAMAALRHSARLPMRERRKIAALEAMSRPALAESCRLHNALLATDTTDAEVIRGATGSCCCDAQVVPDARSPSGYSFVTSHQTYFWAWRRLLEADSTSEVPYGGINGLLIANTFRFGCLGEDVSEFCPLDKRMSAYILVDHDTLRAIPWPAGGIRWGRPVGDTTSPEVVLAAMRAKVAMVRPVVDRWKLNFPDSRGPAVAYTNLAQVLGQPELALPVIRDFSSPRTVGIWGQLRHAIEILFQLERPREAVALYDSLQQACTAALARGDSSLIAIRPSLDTLGVALGRVPPDLATRGTYYAYGPNATDLIRRLYGLGPDSLLPFEADSGRRYRLLPRFRGPDGRANAAGDSALASDRLWYSMVGFHDRRSLLVADTVDRPPWYRQLQVFQVRFASGDTTAARELLRRWDYHLYLGAPSVPYLHEDYVFPAESYLELGDSAAALERLRDYWQKFTHSQLHPWASILLPRVLIRYGDLAYAMHQRDDAIRAYRFITELWDHADPLFQPTVQRARTRLEELTARTN